MWPAFYDGILGFGYVENGEWQKAEEAGRRGTKIDADDNWAHHAVAHTLLCKSLHLVLCESP